VFVPQTLPLKQVTWARKSAVEEERFFFDDAESDDDSEGGRRIIVSSKLATAFPRAPTDAPQLSIDPIHHFSSSIC
jgi:hypothetical protein